MKNRIRTLKLVMAGAVLAIAMPAVAQNSISTHVASTCTVDEDNSALYQFTGGEMAFRAGQTGAITARCNVVNPRDDGQNPQWSVLEVVYRDPDGAGANQVVATLKRVSTAGVTSTVAGAVFNSNNSPASSSAQVRTINFAHAFNFFSHAYFIELRVVRSAATSQDNPAAYVARLMVAGPE